MTRKTKYKSLIYRFSLFSSNVIVFVITSGFGSSSTFKTLHKSSVVSVFGRETVSFLCYYHYYSQCQYSHKYTDDKECFRVILTIYVIVETCFFSREKRKTQ